MSEHCSDLVTIQAVRRIADGVNDAKKKLLMGDVVAGGGVRMDWTRRGTSI
jgi:hypothetical protein